MSDVVDWQRLTARLREKPEDLDSLAFAVAAIREGGGSGDALGLVTRLAESSDRPEHALALSEAHYRVGDVESALRVLLSSRKAAASRRRLNEVTRRIGPRLQDRLRFFQCHLVWSFTGKDVVDFGAAMPADFVAGVDPASWIAVGPRAGESSSGFYRSTQGADPLLPLPGASADIVFSSSFLERVGELGVALAEMYRVLRPEGGVYAEFSPIWSSATGHHLSGRGRTLLEGAGLWPLEPWAHLVYSRGRMRDLLAEKLSSDEVKYVERWLYRRPTLNRLFYEDYVTLLHQSPFAVKRCSGLPGRSPDRRASRVLRRRHPGRERFEYRGLRTILEKPAGGSRSDVLLGDPPEAREELLVRDAVRQLVDDATFEISKIGGRGGGLGPRAEGRQVYVARCGRRDLVVKVYHSAKTRAVGCNFALDVLRRQGVPTPRVLGVDPTGRFFGRPLVVQTLEPGMPLDRWITEKAPPVEQRDEILGHLGASLAKIHAFSWDGGFGGLTDSGSADFESWPRYLSERRFQLWSGKWVRLSDLEAIVGGGFLSEAERAVLGEFFAKRVPSLDLERPSLLHNDLTLKNVLVARSGTRITSILDLANAIGGDPAYELARFEYFYRETDYCRPVFDGYGERSTDFLDRQRLYLVVILVEKLHWIRGREENYPGRRESDLALLRQLLAVLG